MLRSSKLCFPLDVEGIVALEVKRSFNLGAAFPTRGREDERTKTEFQSRRRIPSEIAHVNPGRHFALFAMPSVFDVLIFFPDGKEPEISQLSSTSLSPKWLALCTDILAENGPVFKRPVGGALAHFDVEMAGPIGRLFVDKIQCFDFWICCKQHCEQHRAATEHFEQFFRKACSMADSSPTAAALASLQRLNVADGLILFDNCSSEIDPDQKAAIAQLALHLAYVYFEYGQQTA